MELEPRTTAPAHATGAVEFVPLSTVAEDTTFRLRGEGDVAALAASIGRLGHLVPIELRPLPGAPEDPPRYQVVAGFRRLAALRLLARERVLARVHSALDDEDAWGIALAQALLGEPLVGSELEALRARLRAEGLAPWADELVDEALVRAPLEPEQRERFFDFLCALPGAPAAPAAGDEEGAGADDATAAGTDGTRSYVGQPARQAPASAPASWAPAAPAVEQPEIASREPDEIGTSAAAAEQPGVASPEPDEAGPSAAAAEQEPIGAGAAEGEEIRAELVRAAPAEPTAPPVAAAEAANGEVASREPEEVEVTPEELAADVARRLSELNQDLALAFEAWAELPEEGRRMIVEQARYVAELFPHLGERAASVDAGREEG